jgi:hypothetical protein
VADVPAGTLVDVGRHVIPDRDIPINHFYLTLLHLSPKRIYTGFVNAYSTLMQ